jgi:hypothetical protein
VSDEKELKPLTKKHQRVLDEYLLCWVQWRAYVKVYPDKTPEVARVLSSRLFADDNFSAHLEARLNEVHMSADEALKLTAEIARSDLGVFFKVVDEWMFNPLPSYEILDEQEVERKKDDGTKEKVVSYRVRHVALDMDKVIDPRYSYLLKSFSDSTKFGLKIETHSKHEAIRDILKVKGKIKSDNQFELVVRYANPNDKPTDSA